MSLVNSFKKVLVANFVEIARTDDEVAEQAQDKKERSGPAQAPAAPAAPTASAAPAAPAPTRDVPAAAPAQARVVPVAPAPPQVAVPPRVQPAVPPANAPGRMPGLEPLRAPGSAPAPARLPDVDPLARTAAARREEAESAMRFQPAPAPADIPPPLPPPIPVPVAVVAPPAPIVEPESSASKTTVVIEASAVAAAAAAPPKPEPVEPLSLVREDGTVDYERIYAQAALPAAIAFTAERALSMLMDLPTDLPLKLKRLTVKATLDAVSTAVGAELPTTIVADAERKRDALESYLADLAVQTSAIREEREAEIARLRAQIIAAETAHDQATIGARARIEEFEQVIGFFNIPESRPVEYHPDSYDDAEPTEGEVPTFANDDAVRRLLGLPIQEIEA